MLSNARKDHSSPLFLWLLAIVDIPEYSALSEAIVRLTGEGMGKIVNNPQSD